MKEDVGLLGGVKKKQNSAKSVSQICKVISLKKLGAFMLKLLFLCFVLQCSLLVGEDLLLTDSFALDLNSRIQNNRSHKGKTIKFEYEQYFIWILKNLFHHKLQPELPLKSEWPQLVTNQNAMDVKPFFSSSRVDFENFVLDFSAEKNVSENVFLFTPVFDLCHVLSFADSSMKNYIEWKVSVIKKLLNSRTIAKNLVYIHSNNLLSWYLSKQ